MSILWFKYRIEPSSTAKVPHRKTLCGTSLALSDNDLRAGTAKYRVERQLSRDACVCVRACAPMCDVCIHGLMTIVQIFVVEFLPFYAVLRGTKQANGIKHWVFQYRIGKKLCGTYAVLSASMRY